MKYSKIHNLIEIFGQQAGFEIGYSGQAAFEDALKKNNLWDWDDISNPLISALEKANFKHGSISVDIEVDDKLNVKYYVLGASPQQANILASAIARTFSVPHKKALIKEKVTPIKARWNWIKNVTFEE